MIRHLPLCVYPLSTQCHHMWWNLPGPPPPFLHTTSNQKMETRTGLGTRLLLGQTNASFPGHMRDTTLLLRHSLIPRPVWLTEGLYCINSTVRAINGGIRRLRQEARKAAAMLSWFISTIPCQNLKIERVGWGTKTEQTALALVALDVSCSPSMEIFS